MFTEDHRKRAEEKDIERKNTLDLFVKWVKGSPNETLPKYINLIPSKYQGVLTRSYAGVATKSECIKAKCLDCSGYTKSEITECTVKTCPLWRVRPYQPKDRNE